MIGLGGILGEGSRDSREVIGGEGIWGNKSDWEWGKRRGEMGLREKDGEEFDEVQVALIPIIEGHVPNEFVVRGHVVVGDHAAKPTGPELHSDVSSDEVMRATRVARARKGGDTFNPSRPMG
jgi:hypothetical protein